jgi:hypothetical protein
MDRPLREANPSLSGTHLSPIELLEPLEQATGKVKGDNRSRVAADKGTGEAIFRSRFLAGPKLLAKSFSKCHHFYILGV